MEWPFPGFVPSAFPSIGTERWNGVEILRPTTLLWGKCSEFARHGADVSIATLRFGRTALLKDLANWAGVERVDPWERFRGEPVSGSPATLRRRLLFCLAYAFQEILDMSPMRYLQIRRLNRAREFLRKASRDKASASQCPFSAGFTYLRRFAATDRAFSGEAPSTTLARPAE